ncbi:purine-binding chemotaxis protein CheW [Rhodanobacter sp. ANJX3]|uniref:chemotaxis protein CheW n=1 Tax=Rhodanobacter sp. ANJX3 TaxID=2723083 RepID=UPI00160D9717|nr:chemotaxis protein CheW [Rhodanobacter sp. ANJX3]MBB5359934.1 purine-binding chemotaxis protein CheW [Rhodanobacter sp. ANJX3]
MSHPYHADTIARQPWLAFQLAGQHYAAPLSHVSEVIHDHAPTPVPGAADDLLGICQLRGNIVPLIDGRRRLGLDAAPPGDVESVRIVVFAYEGHRVGLRVDAVGDILRPTAEAIDAPPPNRSKHDDDPVQAVLAWQGHFVALLDVPRLCRLAPDLHRVA